MAGQTLTILAQTFTFQGGYPSFDPNLPTVFNGEVYGTDLNGNRLTPNVSLVPEPSTWAMLGLGAAAARLAASRQRRVA